MAQWKGYETLKDDHSIELERIAHENQISGMPPEKAEKEAFTFYMQNVLMDGAVFHAKSFVYFEYKDPEMASLHKAILCLYSVKGIDTRKLLQHFDIQDRQLLQPNEKSIYHPSDFLVLKYR